MFRGIFWEIGPQHPDVSQHIRSSDSGVDARRRDRDPNLLDWVAELLDGPANFPDVTLIVGAEKELEAKVRDAPPLYFPSFFSPRREKVSV